MNFLESGIAPYVAPSGSLVRFDENLTKAQEAARQAKSPWVYAVDENNVLKGIVYTPDLSSGNAEEKVSNFARKLVAVRKSAALWQLLNIMNGENAEKQRFDELPVVDDQNKLIGVVNREDLRWKLSSVQIPLSALSAMPGSTLSGSLSGR